MSKAEELIQRCIHPADNIAALDLDEPEYRWSYLVFLQVLGKYLDIKVEFGEIDYLFQYARESLLAYAKWILENEAPYKDVLHKVLIPTETWPAHDIRKCHVLHVASEYVGQKRGAAFAQSTVGGGDGQGEMRHQEKQGSGEMDHSKERESRRPSGAAGARRRAA